MIGEVKGEVAIGDAVEVWFDPIDDDVTLAKWQPAGTPAPEPEPEETSDLPVWELPITPTLVVSTALATRDFQDVHHDRDLSQSYGSQDIFLNILTTTGLVQRYVGDALRASGEELDLAGIALRLGAPAYPGDELVFTGSRDGNTVSVVGSVSLGDHVTATVTLR
jgi:hypothetical protein